MSGTYYSTQPLMPFIGATKNAAGTITLAPVTLSGTATDNRKEIDVDGMQQLVLYIRYITGAATTGTLNMTVEFSPDGTNYYQEATEAVATSTVTEYQGARQFAGAVAATTYSFTVAIPIAHKGKFRMSFTETKSGSNYGTLSILAVPSGQ